MWIDMLRVRCGVFHYVTVTIKETHTYITKDRERGTGFDTARETGHPGGVEVIENCIYMNYKTDYSTVFLCPPRLKHH